MNLSTIFRIAEQIGMREKDQNLTDESSCKQQSTPQNKTKKMVEQFLWDKNVHRLKA